MAIVMRAREAADALYEEIRSETKTIKEQGAVPHVSVILVEGDPASAYYAEAKRKVAERLGISYKLHTFEQTAAQEEILTLIEALNADPNVHGIMVELPLPAHISTAAVEQTVSPLKDIDGVTPANKLATMTGAPGLYPATPQACIKLAKHYGYSLEGVNVALIGRGQTVGLPLFHMLQRENATVTLCHSRTPDIAFHLSHADIAFVAVGRPGIVQSGMVHSRLALIDAGINETASGAIVGDVAPDAAEHAAALSPVPGGVGTLTTAVLFENLLKAIKLQTAVKEADQA